MIHVLYHSSCYDGFGSAYAAWKNFEAIGMVSGVAYHAVSYGFKPPQLMDESGLLDCKKLYILDFSYDEETLVELNEKYGCHIVVIDHHKTAQEKLESIIGKYSWLEINFDMNKSGALMTWEYFHGSVEESFHNPVVPEIPQLIAHISDRDLWKFEMEGTEEVHKALVSYPMDFKLWDSFDVEELKKEGAVLKRMYDNLVENICKHPFKRKIGDYEVPVVNTTIAWSEVGQKLLEKFPDAPFVASFTVFDEQVMWSLRSRSDFDVSEIAKKFGGGGHKQAAGFKTARF